MPASLHPHPRSLGREIAIKPFRFLTVLQSPFLELSTVRIHKRNLLKARVRTSSVKCSLHVIASGSLYFIFTLRSGTGRASRVADNG